MDAHVPMGRPRSSSSTPRRSSRPRISKDLIRQNQRERLVTALAGCVVEKGYRSTTVADVVSTARVGRNTFYDCFSSKDHAAFHLLKLVVPVLEVKKLEGSVFVLALEIAGRLKLDDQLGASALVADAERLLNKQVDVEPVEPQGGADEPPELSKLPPGRHGLPRSFVVENQRTRLLAGTARAIYEKGYERATIADITRHAAVSRRTFYEHFDGTRDALFMMVAEAEKTDGPYPWHDVDLGLGSLFAEVVAAAFCGEDIDSELRRKAGQTVVRMLAAQLDVAVAA